MSYNGGSRKRKWEVSGLAVVWTCVRVCWVDAIMHFTPAKLLLYLLSISLITHFTQ